MPRYAITKLFWATAYVAVMTLLVAKLYGLRQWSLEQLATPQAQAEWDEWRQGAEDQSHGAGPVKRAVPRSSEPPALVLLRDHFAVCVAATVVVSSVPVVLAMIGLSALFARGRDPNPDDPSAAGRYQHTTHPKAHQEAPDASRRE